MKFLNKTFLTVGALSLLLSANSVMAADLATSGLNGKVEWVQSQQWKSPASTIDFCQSLDGKFTFFLTSDHKVMVYNSKGIEQGAIPVSKGVTAIDIAPQGEVLYLQDSQKNIFSSLKIDFVVDINTIGSPILGKVDAPVTITVFTDFECPYCKKFAPMMHEVFDANAEQVKIVFKNMPLNFHQFAEPAARGGLAANNQGKFWEYHDLIFATKKLKGSTVTEVAKKLGLDMKKFKADMESATVKSQVKKDMIDAKEAGVTGTPTTFVNGRKVKQRNPQGFQIMINAELQKKGLLK